MPFDADKSTNKTSIPLYVNVCSGLIVTGIIFFTYGTSPAVFNYYCLISYNPQDYL